MFKWLVEYNSMRCGAQAKIKIYLKFLKFPLDIRKTRDKLSFALLAGARDLYWLPLQVLTMIGTSLVQ